MNDTNTHLLRKMAKKYIWWKTPDDAVDRPERIIAQVMNIGDFDDVRLVINAYGESYLREIIKKATAGQFNKRSWAYWHYRLGLAEFGRLPAMPVREIQ